MFKFSRVIVPTLLSVNAIGFAYDAEAQPTRKQPQQASPSANPTLLVAKPPKNYVEFTKRFPGGTPAQYMGCLADAYVVKLRSQRPPASSQAQAVTNLWQDQRNNALSGVYYQIVSHSKVTVQEATPENVEADMKALSIGGATFALVTRDATEENRQLAQGQPFILRLNAQSNTQPPAMAGFRPGDTRTENVERVRKTVAALAKQNFHFVCVDTLGAKTPAWVTDQSKLQRPARKL